MKPKKSNPETMVFVKGQVLEEHRQLPDRDDWAEDELAEDLLTHEQIQERVRELGELLTGDYQGKDLLLIGVLRGAVLFLADLSRVIDLPLAVDFMAVSSYGHSTQTSGVVRILKDLDEDIKGRDVVLVEDVVDTGLTLNYLLKNLVSRGPASLEVCTLLRKRDKQRVALNIKYVGFDIPDRFVVGYGLDYAEKYRNLPAVSALRPGLED